LSGGAAPTGGAASTNRVATHWRALEVAHRRLLELADDRILVASPLGIHRGTTPDRHDVRPSETARMA
jgi:hypothetical protein